MQTITIRSITNQDFTRVDNDVNGNPRYVLHFLAVDDQYVIALDIARKFGGKKYHNSKYGGGIVIQSYNLENDIYSIQESIIEYNSGRYATYLLDCFDNQDGSYSDRTIKDVVLSIQGKYKTEYGFQQNFYTEKACESYLRGLGGFDHEYENYQIEKLGKGRLKALRKNASQTTIEHYCDSVYWQELGKALHSILNITFEV